jgi:hypothetical protein
MMGRNWRPAFDLAVVRRELEIIHRGLHCNAVRLQGLDPARLDAAAEIALPLGMEVWYSPELWDRKPGPTIEYLRSAARSAEALRRRWPDRIVFSVGSEVTLFMQGFVPGRNVLKRLSNPKLSETIRAGTHLPALRAFLAEANDAVRAEFHGKVTYASLPMERVDWSLFDYVGVDLYRGAPMTDRYAELIGRYRSFGKPLANMEFGCCTFRGAEDLGGRGWQIIDWTKRPPRLTGPYVYDQGAQAREVADLLRANEAAGVDATFVFTFVEPGPEPASRERATLSRLGFDPDIVHYSLVKTHPDGRAGTAYPGVPWEPKESFHAVAEYYAAH